MIPLLGEEQKGDLHVRRKSVPVALGTSLVRDSDDETQSKKKERRKCKMHTERTIEVHIPYRTAERRTRMKRHFPADLRMQHTFQFESPLDGTALKSINSRDDLISKQGVCTSVNNEIRSKKQLHLPSLIHLQKPTLQRSPPQPRTQSEPLSLPLLSTPQQRDFPHIIHDAVASHSQKGSTHRASPRATISIATYKHRHHRRVAQQERATCFKVAM